MPAKTQKQANLMRAAAHGASFPKAKAIRQSMTPDQIREFEHTSKKPKHTPYSETHAYNWRSRKNLKRGHDA